MQNENAFKTIDFSRLRAVVVGDIIADQFVYGAISRVSREAPVFILRHEETATIAGGAANCAANCAAFGAQTTLIGTVGRDEQGTAILETLRRAQVNVEKVFRDERRTTTKMRVFAGQTHAPRQQVIRIDYENDALLSAEARRGMREILPEALENADVVIVSDYNYGVADDDLATFLTAECRRRAIPLFVDSRFRLASFKGATAATPNQSEIEEIARQTFTNETDLGAFAERFRAEMNFDALLVTRGSEGFLLSRKNAATLTERAVGSLEAVDVTGAGDTVMAAFALTCATGKNFAEAAEIANVAGGIVVMKRGTSVVTPAELNEALARLNVQ